MTCWPVSPCRFRRAPGSPPVPYPTWRRSTRIWSPGRILPGDQIRVDLLQVGYGTGGRPGARRNRHGDTGQHVIRPRGGQGEHIAEPGGRRVAGGEGRQVPALLDRLQDRGVIE